MEYMYNYLTTQMVPLYFISSPEITVQSSVYYE